MSEDFKLFENEYGYFDLQIENGQIVRTSGLDTALKLSIYSKARASSDLIQEPTAREGHFLDVLRSRAIGSLAWTKIKQGAINSQTLNFLESEYTKALSWLIDENIVENYTVQVLNTNNSTIQVNITIEGKSSADSFEYQLLLNTN